MESSPTRLAAGRDSLLTDYRPPASPTRDRDRYWLHVLLFGLTLLCTTWTGGIWAGRFLAYTQAGAPLFEMPAVLAQVLLISNGPVPVYGGMLLDGLLFSLSLLAFLTVHEFGHYFAARAHGIRVSLPYFIPFGTLGIGTLGAVIRIREPIPSTRKLFDVGAAGPLAGFVVALGVLLYALATLPGPEYLMGLDGHEAIKSYIQREGAFPDRLLEEPGPGLLVFEIGQTPLYWLLTQFFADVPPPYEAIHYPMLLAGWFGLFFTALNLLPVGQLDGGHIVYSLVGPVWHRRIARGFVCVLLLSASVGFVDETIPEIYAWKPWLGPYAWFILGSILYFFLARIFQGDHRLIAPALLGIVGVTALADVLGGLLSGIGYVGWFVWTLLIVFLIKVDHPPVVVPERLTPGRKALAIVSIVIFILCFSIQPIVVR